MKDVVVVLAVVLVAFALLLVMVLATSLLTSLVPALTQVLVVSLFLANNAKSLVCCVGDKGVTNDNIASLKAVASDGHRNPVSPES